MQYGVAMIYRTVGKPYKLHLISLGVWFSWSWFPPMAYISAWVSCWFFLNRTVDESSCESAFCEVVTCGRKYFLVARNIIVLRFFDNSGARDKSGACFPAVKKIFFNRKDRRVAQPSPPCPPTPSFDWGNYRSVNFRKCEMWTVVLCGIFS